MLRYGTDSKQCVRQELSKWKSGQATAYSLYALLDQPRFNRERKPQKAFGLAPKGVPGRCDYQIFQQRHCYGLRAAKAGYVEHYVECTFAQHVGQPKLALDGLSHHLAAASQFFTHLCRRAAPVGSKRRNGGFLGNRRRTARRILVHYRNRADHLLRADRPTDSPAGHAHHLGQTRNYNRVRIKLGNRRWPFLEIQLAIYLV